MTKRTLAAFCLALAYAGPTLAQNPIVDAGKQPQAAVEQPAVAQPVAVTVSTTTTTTTPSPVVVDMPSPSPSSSSTLAGFLANVAVPSSDTPSGRFWLTGDGVLGWIERSPLPSLVTTSPAGTSQGAAGVLGAASTTTLFGSDSVNGDMRWGFKVGTGYWLDEERTFSLEAGFMMLESQSAPFSANSNSNPILARPYIDATTNTQQAVLIAFPGTSTGSVDVLASSGNFMEAHLDLAGNIINESHFKLDCLLGYRFYRYDDGLRINQSIVPAGGAFAAGTEIDSSDQFSAENVFNGGEVGLRGEFLWQDFTLGLLGKIAAGNLHRDIEINGTQTVTAPSAAPVVSSGGVNALSSNIGRFTNNDWTYMPEFGANLSWRYSNHINFQLGYSFLFLADVARAADQVDTTINPNLFPPPQSPTTPSRPTLTLDRTDIWVQTFTFGVEFRF